MRIVDESGRDLRGVTLWLTKAELDELGSRTEGFFEQPAEHRSTYGPDKGWHTAIVSENARLVALAVPTDLREALAAAELRADPDVDEATRAGVLADERFYRSVLQVVADGAVGAELDERLLVPRGVIEAAITVLAQREWIVRMRGPGPHRVEAELTELGRSVLSLPE